MIIISTCLYFIFFFSSRRRHTRYIGDWSSDVCSSDLGLEDVQGPEQTFGDQFVERVLDEEDDVLPELDRADERDRARKNQRAITLQRRAESDELAKGQDAQRHVPHVGVTQVHSVFDIAHDEVARRDEEEEKELRLLYAIESECGAKSQKQNERTNQKQIDQVTMPGAVAGQDRIGERVIFADGKLICRA